MKATWKKLLSSGDTAPEARWGHTSSSFGSHIIVFGGTGSSKLYNDIQIYNTTQNKWHVAETRGVPPNPRYAHSTTTLNDGKLLIFGGKGTKHFADIHIFDPDRLTWLRSSKAFSESRAGHTAVLSPDGARIIIFGGTSNHSKYFDNVFLLDVATLVCGKIDTHGESPPKLSGHCAFLYRRQMLVFGGYDGKRYYNDIYSLDLDTLAWSKITPQGNPPKARSGHSATIIHGGTHLLVFGGCGADSNFLSDVHALRMADMTWIQPETQGADPHPRFRHTSVQIGNTLYFFAGTAGGNLLADMMALELDLQNTPTSIPIPIASTLNSASVASTSTSSTLLPPYPSITVSGTSPQPHSNLSYPQPPPPSPTAITPISYSSSTYDSASSSSTSTSSSNLAPRTPSQMRAFSNSPVPYNPVSSSPPSSSSSTTTTTASSSSDAVGIPVDPAELSRLYMSAMMALKLEKQQRMDYEHELERIKLSLDPKSVQGAS